MSAAPVTPIRSRLESTLLASTLLATLAERHGLPAPKLREIMVDVARLSEFELGLIITSARRAGRRGGR